MAEAGDLRNHVAPMLSDGQCALKVNDQGAYNFLTIAMTTWTGHQTYIVRNSLAQLLTLSSSLPESRLITLRGPLLLVDYISTMCAKLNVI
jgi:hypothetical protein